MTEQSRVSWEKLMQLKLNYPKDPGNFVSEFFKRVTDLILF